MTAATLMLETISDSGRRDVGVEKDIASVSVSVLSSLETMLATMCADVNEWAAGWCKVLTFVKSQKRAPQQLSELDLDVPKHLRYMLTADPSGGVKAETLSGSPAKAQAARDGSDGDPSSSRSQSLHLGCARVHTPVQQPHSLTATTDHHHSIQIVILILILMVNRMPNAKWPNQTIKYSSCMNACVMRL